MDAWVRVTWQPFRVVGSETLAHNARAQVTHIESVGKYMALFAHAVLTSLIPMRNDEIPCN